MLKEQKISVEEAIRLLDAVETESTDSGVRRFRVVVSENGRVTANITLPLNLIHSAAQFVSVSSDVDWGDIISRIRAGAVGKIVDIEQPEENRKIEIIVE